MDSLFTRRILLLLLTVTIAACNNDMKAFNSNINSAENQQSQQNIINGIEVTNGTKEETPTAKEPSAVQCMNNQACAMQKALNDFRQDYGLQRLKFDPICGIITMAHAKDMHTRNYFAHSSPEGNRAAQRYKRYGSYYLILENLAFGSDDIELTISDWFNSPSHRDALLSREVTHHGVGVWGQGHRTYWAHCMTVPR